MQRIIILLFLLSGCVRVELVPFPDASDDVLFSDISNNDLGGISGQGGVLGTGGMETTTGGESGSIGGMSGEDAGIDTQSDIQLDTGTDIETDTLPILNTPGQLIITEIMLDTTAAISDDVGEWFEVLNPSDNIYSLTGCIISDTNNSEVIASNIYIQPHQFFTFARSMPGFTADYTYSLIKFADEGDQVRIRCNGILIDIVNFSLFNLLKGYSLSLDPNHYNDIDNDISTNWCHSQQSYTITTKGIDFGSPKISNTICQ